MKKHSTLSFTLFILVFNLSMGICSEGALPTAVENDRQAEIMLNHAKKVMKERIGIEHKFPIEIILKTGSELDSLMPDSHYRGRIIGIHTFEKGRHIVYMMKNSGRDDFFGTLCHELTHGWQSENCPNQDIYLTEGLAVWVQYKCLMWDGAYVKANDLNQYIADPVYGVGYRFVQSLEKQYGEKGVLSRIKELKTMPK